MVGSFRVGFAEGAYRWTDETFSLEIVPGQKKLMHDKPKKESNFWPMVMIPEPAPFTIHGMGLGSDM